MSDPVSSYITVAYVQGKIRGKRGCQTLRRVNFAVLSSISDIGLRRGSILALKGHLYMGSLVSSIT